MLREGRDYAYKDCSYNYYKKIMLREGRGYTYRVRIYGWYKKITLKIIFIRRPLLDCNCCGLVEFIPKL